MADRLWLHAVTLVFKEEIVKPAHRGRHIRIPQNDRHVPARGGLRDHSQRESVQRAQDSRGEVSILTQHVANGT